MEASPWAGDSAPDLDGGELDLFREFDAEIHRLADRVDPAHPGDVEDAGRFDEQSLAGWLRERGASERVLQTAETRIAVGSSSVPTSEMSLLAYAAKLAAGATPTGLRLHLDGARAGWRRSSPSTSTFEPGRRWPRWRRTGAA